MDNDIQVQNIPVNINYDDPQAIRKLIVVAKQTLQKINELAEKINLLEEKVMK